MNLELLLAALLTLAVETAFLALTYRRDAAFLALCAAANAATNLTLNLILVLLPGSAAAWAVYAGGRRRRRRIRRLRLRLWPLEEALLAHARR